MKREQERVTGRRAAGDGWRWSGSWSAALAGAADRPARAQGPAGRSRPAAAAASGPAPLPPPPPYSLPWQLRPVTAANVVRSDTTVSFHELGGTSASTVASTLLLSYRLLPRFAPVVRMAYIHNAPGSAPGTGNAFVNPLVGATSSFDLAPGLRLGLFLGFTVPIGQGGGAPAGMNATAAAAAAGINARSAMDNALFAVNYFTAIPGRGAGLQPGRLHRPGRGHRAAARAGAQPGGGAGPVAHQLHQRPAPRVLHRCRCCRWAASCASSAGCRARRARRCGPTAARPSASRWGPAPTSSWATAGCAPGIAYAQGIDAPMKTRKDRIVQLDIPFVF